MTAGVAEIPPGSNRGPRVDQYLTGYDSRPYLLCGLRAADKPCPLCAGKPGPTPACKGSPWCARFARWCVETAARQLGQSSPFTASWGSLASAAKWRSAAELRRSWTTTPAPGRIGCMVRPDGSGHVVLVARVLGDEIENIEGNEPKGVEVRRRKIAAMAGFVELG
jgi:hypothetical protein